MPLYYMEYPSGRNGEGPWVKRTYGALVFCLYYLK